MRTFTLAAAISLTASSALAEPAASDGARTCLNAQFIDHTHVVNKNTVLFYMRGGKIYQNDLASPCPGLEVHGFAVQGHDLEICGGQGIEVIISHQVCQLGHRFVPYTPPPAGH